MEGRRDPYIGPRPFERNDKHQLFGRDREATELLSLIIAHPVVLLYSQSGAGKTSLLNAKIIPMLEQRRSEVLGPARVSGELPTDINGSKIENIFTFNALMSLQAYVADISEFEAKSCANYLKPGPLPDPREGVPAPRVLIFDQFEEIFTTCADRWKDREGFFDDIGAALEADRRLRVVLAMREEYVASLDPYVTILPERVRTRFRLERLREAAALLAVKKPLEGTGRSFAPGVAETLVKNLMQIPIKSPNGTTQVPGEFVEPVQLQVVCKNLWDSVPPDLPVISDDHIQACGDVDEALSAYYEQCIRKVAETGIKEGTLRRWFEKNLITPQGTRGTVYRDERTTGGLSNDVVKMLENHHLVRIEIRGGAPWYELTHDRFIGPIMKSNQQWRAERDTGNITIQEMEQRAQDWLAAGKPVEKLMTQDELNEVKGRVANAEAEGMEVSDTLKEFKRKSREVIDQKKMSKLRAQRRMLVSGVVALALMLVVTGLATFFAVKARGKAEDATFIERGNLAEQLAKDEGKEIDALVLGIKAVGPRLIEAKDPPEKAVEGLRAALQATGDAVWLRGHSDKPTEGAFSPDGERVLTVSPKEICVWNVNTGEPLLGACLKNSPGFLWSSATFTPDGNRVNTQVYEDRTKLSPPDDLPSPLNTEIWNLQTGKAYEEINGLLWRAYEARFFEDGTRLVVAEWDKAHIIDAGTGRQIVSLQNPCTRMTDLRISSRETRVAASNLHGCVQMWDASTGKLILSFKNESNERNPYSVIEFSPDGSRLFFIDNDAETERVDSKVKVWDANTGHSLFSFNSDGVNPKQALFSRDGAKIVIQTDKALRVHDTSDGRLLNTFPLNSSDEIEPIFKDMYVINNKLENNESVITIMDATSGQIVYEIKTTISRLTHIAVSDDAKYVLAAGEKSAPRVWHLGKDVTPIEKRSAKELLDSACEQLRYQPEWEKVKQWCDRQQ